MQRCAGLPCNSRHLEVRAAVVDDDVRHCLQAMLVQLLYQLPQLALRMPAGQGLERHSRVEAFALQLLRACWRSGKLSLLCKAKHVIKDSTTGSTCRAAARDSCVWHMS